jgi:hypothetical protein
MLREQRQAKLFALAESRPATERNTMKGAVRAYPFEKQTKKLKFARNATNKHMRQFKNQYVIPEATALPSTHISKELAPVNEYVLRSQYLRHGPNLHRERRLEQLNVYDRKNRTPSPSEPIIPSNSPR